MPLYKPDTLGHTNYLLIPNLFHVVQIRYVVAWKLHETVGMKWSTRTLICALSLLCFKGRVTRICFELSMSTEGLHSRCRSLVTCHGSLAQPQTFSLLMIYILTISSLMLQSPVINVKFLWVNPGQQCLGTGCYCPRGSLKVQSHPRTQEIGP